MCPTAGSLSPKRTSPRLLLSLLRSITLESAESIGAFADDDNFAVNWANRFRRFRCALDNLGGASTPPSRGGWIPINDGAFGSVVVVQKGIDAGGTTRVLDIGFDASIGDMIFFAVGVIAAGGRMNVEETAPVGGAILG